MSTEGILRKRGYQVLRKIGEGSFSVVKLASSGKHGCDVAIKIVDQRVLSKEVVNKFLPRELEILKIVKHDHVTCVYEIIKSNKGRIFIVMQPAATDLQQRIQQESKIPEDRAKTMFTQIVSAVQYLHQNNIVHRDLKCDNILLTADDQIKISDFGFSRFTDHQPSRTFCGSLAYSPPELLNGVPHDPKKSDIWSLGVVLYAMTTGCLPYDFSNRGKQLEAQRQAVVYPHDAVLTQSCKDLISFMLHISPAERPDIQQVIDHPWLQQADLRNAVAQ